MDAALGERFRAAREARGLTLADVAEQIRIRSVYLAAIEDENWGAIGAPVYIRGFLRTYARFLGLDPEEAVATFAAHHTPPTPPIETEAASEIAAKEPVGRGLSLAVWAAAAVAVVLIAFVVFNELSLHGQSSPPAALVAATATPPAALPSVTPSVSPSVSPTVPPGAAPETIAVHLSAPSWLRVTVDGNVSMEGTFPAGTAKSFHGKAATLRIGNAGGVEVVVDGRSLGKLGSTGDVVERTFAL